MARFDVTLTREMALTSAAAFSALLLIFVVIILVRVLGKAVIGDLEPDAVLPLLGFGVVRVLPVLLSLGLFVGVFMTLGRLWRDSEAVIWLSSGMGPLRWLRPVSLFALPMVALIALVSFEALPWSVQKKSEFENLLKSRDEVSALAPGLFTEYANGQRVHFVETVSEDGLRIGNVFVHSMLNGRASVIVASQGHVEDHPNGVRYLVLENGRRYEGTPGDAEFRFANFARYGVRIEGVAPADVRVDQRMLSTAALLTDPTPVNLGEWVWRLGYPLSALLLAFLALPLSYTNPRAGRSFNVVFAILIYVAYNNFVGLSQGWVARGELSATQAVLAVHGVMLALVLVWMWRRFQRPGG